MSVEVIWRTSTTREVKTIFSVTSTGIQLVRYTERGRELDRVARQMVQRTEEDRSGRLGEHKRDLLHHPLREPIAEVEKDKETSGEQLLIRCMVSFRQKYTYRPLHLLKRRLHEEEMRATALGARGYVRMQEKCEQLMTCLKQLIEALEGMNHATSDTSLGTQR